MAYATDQILNLVDISRQATSPLEAGIAMSFVEHASAIDLVPWRTINTTRMRWLRRDGPFAKPKWVNVNAGAPKVKSALKEQSEVLYHMAADIDVDFRLLKDKNLHGNIRAEETDALIEGLGLMLTNTFFWGDSNVPIDADDLGNDVYEPDGVLTRLAQGAARGHDPSLRRSAAGADVSSGGFAGSDGYKLLRQCDEISVRMSKGKHQDSSKTSGGRLFMDIALYAAWGDILRRSGGFAETKDRYDREIRTLHGFEITIVGQHTYNINQDTDANKILGWQDAAGVRNSSGNFQSLVFVRFGTNDVEGLQLESMHAEDIGRVSGTRVLRTMFDWCVGFRSRSATSVGQIYNIKVR